MLNPINVSICLNIGTTLPDTISILHELKIRKREKKIPFSIYIEFTASHYMQQTPGMQCVPV